MFDIGEIGQVSGVATTIATVILVFLFWKTVRQLEATVKLSKIESTYRFRPWVGSSSGIQLMSSTEKHTQYFVTLKNYGEIPASDVVVFFTTKNESITKSEIKSVNDGFSIGPLLPNMEKHYWFFLESELISKTKDDGKTIFIALYFSYTHPGGKSGYGMISCYDPKLGNFVHKEMWTD